jgi:uncharacterized SAM-binding protein YcdF (DUF218 family)
LEIAFTLKAIAKALVLPPAGPMLLALAGLFVTRHAPRAGRVLIWTGALSMVLLCLPVLVTGGSMPDVQSSEAAIMRAVLEAEYGVAVRWIEDRSRNTHENAQFSATLLKADGVATVVLVAHAMDMPRARAEFAAAGIATIAAPTGLSSAGPLRLMDFVPSASALQASHDALYEILANVVLVVSGR